MEGVKQKQLRAVASLSLDDHHLQPGEFESTRTLEDIASRVVVTLSYVAGVTKHDIVWAVNSTARKVD